MTSPREPRPVQAGHGRGGARSGAIWLGLTVAALIVGLPFLLAPRLPPSYVLGWDLAQFVAAGSLVAEGQGHRLYDAEAQYQARLRLVGPEPGVPDQAAHAYFFTYVSPPIKAALYAPASALPFAWFEPLHRAASLALLAAGMYLVRRWLPVPWHTAAAFSLATPWAVASVQAGQDTYFLLFLWAAAARLLADGRPNAAALALSIGLIKPQCVWPGLALLAVRGGGLRGVLAGGLAAYTASWAIVGDPLWPLVWMREAVSTARDTVGGLQFHPAAVLAAAAITLAWLRVPAPALGQATLALPAVALLLLPYPFVYYFLLGALPFWLGVSLLLAWARARWRPALSAAGR